MTRFLSPWITTEDFIDKTPVSLFHKELEPFQTPERDKSLQNYHAVFKKKFKVEKKAIYTLRISADDYYKLYINGQYVGQGVKSAYPNRYHYNEYDISKYVHQGENEIQVHVYYQGLINRVWISGDNRMGLIADIFMDGDFLFGTDGSWGCEKLERYYSCETIGYQTQYLENIDFRIPNQPKKVCIHYADDHIFCELPAPVLEVYSLQAELKPVSDRAFFADITQEMVGTLAFKINGKSGQKVYLQCGEELEGENVVRWKMRCDTSYQETLILSGGEDVFQGYDYKGFRYIRLESDEPFVMADFQIRVQHHAFQEKIQINTQDEPLRQIWELCANTLHYSTQEAFLDCPTREKGQYLGDFTVSGLAYLHLTGDTEMYRLTLYDFAQTAQICKGLMADAACSFMQEIADFSLMYPLQVWNYYQYSHDKQTVQTLMGTIDELLAHFAQYERPDGLLVGVTDKWNLVDWPDVYRDGYDTELSLPIGEYVCHNVINAYYVGAYQIRNKLRKALSMPCDSKADTLAEAFHREFYKEELKLYTDRKDSLHSSLHSNVLPCFFGFEKAEARNSIQTLIQEKGFSCGVFFSYFVLKALVSLGARQEAYKLLTNDGEHSWKNMLREGATTTFEAWSKETKRNTSLCHPWACSPIVVLAEDFPELISRVF